MNANANANQTGNFENYSWNKENYERQLNSSLEVTVNYSQLARTCNLKNKDGK